MNPISLPYEAEVVEHITEAKDIFTLKLRFTDPEIHAAYQFQPGQFNMVYLFGIGEIPISIVSDPENGQTLDHTIRAVGRVTRGLQKLSPGDRLGIRGPYGRGWPMQQAVGKDVFLLTGGLGCAPVVSVIRYITRRREQYHRLIIMQGVKHSHDLIWRDQYQQWADMPETQVLLAASHEVRSNENWPWATGHVTNMIDQAVFNPARTIAMMCGPEAMMRAAIEPLKQEGVDERNIHLSMERNMQCATGHCGHCQYGPHFVCKQGPVFPYSDIRPWFGRKGY